MSEIQELIAELRERYDNWRQRMRARHEPPHIEIIPDIPEVEFMPLDPLSTPTPLPPNSFSSIRLAWLATLCSPELLAQAEQCVHSRRVTRVHALGNRMTGTVQDTRYEDQEILLQDGALIATCTCDLANRKAPTTGLETGTALPLRCRHLVAILLAYLQQQHQDLPILPLTLHDGIPSANTIVTTVTCPVTRQTLVPGQPFYQCKQCGISYSLDGWEFLRKADKGRCCGCEARRTVFLVKPTL